LHPIKISNVFIKSFFGAQQPPVDSRRSTLESRLGDLPKLEMVPCRETKSNNNITQFKIMSIDIGRTLTT